MTIFLPPPKRKKEGKPHRKEPFFILSLKLLLGPLDINELQVSNPGNDLNIHIVRKITQTLYLVFLI